MLKKALVVVVAGCIVIAGALLLHSAREGRRGRPPTVAQLTWEWVTSPNGGFRGLMPGKPEIKEQAPPAAGAEGKVPVLVLARQDLLATFFVFSFDVPARPDDPERHLDAVCASVCTEVKGRRLDVKRATLGRFPGREMRFEYSEGSHVYIQTTRIYEAAPRVFVLGVAVPKEDHPAAYVPVFLDSFSLLKQ